jgi:hypothetical protein
MDRPNHVRSIRGYAVLTKRGFILAGKITREFSHDEAMNYMKPGHSMVPIYNEYHPSEWMDYVRSTKGK